MMLNVHGNNETPPSEEFAQTESLKMKNSRVTDREDGGWGVGGISTCRAALMSHWQLRRGHMVRRGQIGVPDTSPDHRHHG